jgi:Cysteine-rich secretory protein family
VALIAEINQYRMSNGLAAIPASSSLCIVADNHVNDLRDNAPRTPQNCNLHSWSDQGSWSACCYTPDHAQAQCMWDKPGELTNYNSNGYEISYSGSNSPQSAVSGWSNSSGHNNVILNLDIWANQQWGAVGAAQHDGFAHVWFGTASDPN